MGSGGSGGGGGGDGDGGCFGGAGGVDVSFLNHFLWVSLFFCKTFQDKEWTVNE